MPQLAAWFCRSFGQLTFIRYDGSNMFVQNAMLFLNYGVTTQKKVLFINRLHLSGN
jgi:hypothetical protein